MNKSLLFLALLFPFLADAGGFQIQTQSQKANGMAGAFTGLVTDASAVYFNPAGIVFQESNMVDAGFNVMFTRTSFLSPSDGNINSATSITMPFHAYATYHLGNRNLTAGIGINTPYGTSLKWNDDHPGRYIAQRTRFNTLFIQPTISYRFDDHFAAGFGLVGAAGSFKIRKAIAVNDDIEMELKAKGFGFGFNVGAMAHYQKINFSINYRSAVKLNFNSGDATFSNVPKSFVEQNIYPETTGFSSSFKLPSTITLGVGVVATGRIIADIDISYTTWTDFDNFNTTFSDYPSLDNNTDRNFKGTFSVCIGGQYKWSDKMDYRIGGGYDQSPVSDGNLYPDFPDASKLIMSAGASRHLSESLSIDASITMDDYRQRKETDNNQNFNGSYESAKYLIGLGIHYEF